VECNRRPCASLLGNLRSVAPTINPSIRRGRGRGDLLPRLSKEPPRPARRPFRLYEFLKRHSIIDFMRAPIVLLRNSRQAGFGLVEYSVARLGRSESSAAIATIKATMTFSGFIALKSGLTRFNRYYRAKSCHKQNTLREFSGSSRGAGSVHSIPTPIIAGDQIGRCLVPWLSCTPLTCRRCRLVWRPRLGWD
jgi:hypothetical protein